MSDMLQMESSYANLDIQGLLRIHVHSAKSTSGDWGWWQMSISGRAQILVSVLLAGQSDGGVVQKFNGLR